MKKEWLAQLLLLLYWSAYDGYPFYLPQAKRGIAHAHTRLLTSVVGLLYSISSCAASLGWWQATKNELGPHVFQARRS
jgi:hypothetical protein